MAQVEQPEEQNVRSYLREVPRGTRLEQHVVDLRVLNRVDRMLAPRRQELCFA
jgi:hypothetical protein